MSTQNTRLGIMLMVMTTMVFSIQDGLSRHLAGEYNVYLVLMIRYVFFAIFALAIVQVSTGSLKKGLRTAYPILQPLRGVLLIVETALLVYAFTVLGLIESHAVFTSYPLIVAALSGPILGEKVGWRRWTAIGIGFVGVLIILQPGGHVFSLTAIIPLAAATIFALYSLLTRYVSRKDSASTSMAWSALVGAICATAVGVFYWEPMAPSDWVFMLGLCVFGMLSHWMLIKCYEVAEASAVQPFAFLQVGFVSLIGLFFFGETLEQRVIIGGSIILAAGLFTLLRERAKAKA
ncbi:DMT family transporter [Ketogulonicigenium vulgare]|uniref:Putative transporter, RhaT family, DMT superfamily protein n=1 Tax=Ketogulonicigenium vulgare (strain WSH-001) TaxID=759362 RepID=F9Y894_KETVW|nr:DMT family transporter [Ketogulonicigenium vulgare]ADO41530.1 S-adenosylmethionine uptake transporter [Ketogulonicigenium vulgare Y25]AEM42380.1 putative transporter, RhaT family, DMT superfamily protein [Ketogulonicigenium vulgare WSH-001]ALJ80002.1 RhaT family transporter [Ketogulonicigenium vulgare]ANW32889.1 RhaT family transporter [Ketogulonicigenium vulgare]AOZ53464.1 S-adenosylmethionine uptake transporter [Ketogulonicigenium vulgare]